MRGETQQLVSSDLQSAFVSLLERVAPYFASNPEIATWSWAAAALLLAGMAFYYRQPRRRD